MEHESVQLFYENGSLKYTGEVHNKMPEGFGRSYYENGVLEYSGMWKNGVFHGDGKLYRQDATIRFQGRFENGEFIRSQRNGPLKYEGLYKGDQFDGYGRIFDHDGKTVRYEGEFLNGRYHGIGTLFDSKGSRIYTGQFLNGRFLFPDPPYNSGIDFKPVLHMIDTKTTPFSTFQSHNQKVVYNKNGVFVSYLKSRNDKYTAQTWRLEVTQDFGETFELLYESTDPTNPPCLETDENANIYAFYPNFLDGHSYLMIWKADNGYKYPKKTVIKNSAAGKFCAAYDAVRKRLYYLSSLVRNPSTALPYEQTKDNEEYVRMNNPFTALDLNGETLYTTNLYITGQNAKVEYPQLFVDKDGTIHAAWTTENPKKAYLYWSIQYLASDDGGHVWRKMNGTTVQTPVFADDTGLSDRITTDNEFNMQTWLSNFTVKDHKIHFLYNPVLDDPNKIYGPGIFSTEHYMRYDSSTGRKDIDINSTFRGRYISVWGADGFFSHSTKRQKSPLFYVGRCENRLVCLKSMDNGLTWTDHAISDPFEYDIYAVGGCRYISDDDKIVGTFTERRVDETYSDVFAPARTWFFYIDTGN